MFTACNGSSRYREGQRSSRGGRLEWMMLEEALRFPAQADVRTVHSVTRPSGRGS